MAAEELSKLLQAKWNPINRILVTGASGWIGRETIKLLQLALGNNFDRQVTLAGSRDAKIVVNGMTYNIWNLLDIHPDKRFDLVIHLAFLTQEKAPRLGPIEYSRLNRELSAFVYQICQRSNTKYVFVASSGAADREVWSVYNNPSKKLYGQLKRESEELFLQLQTDNRALVEVCRIWSISGENIQEPQKYAIGSFIAQATSTGNIELISSALIKRAYVDGCELMGVLLLNLLNDRSGLLNSGGFETSLQDLARLVLDELNQNGEITVPIDSKSHELDIYVPDVLQFNTLSQALGVELSSLRDQIRITAKSEAFISADK